MNLKELIIERYNVINPDRKFPELMDQINEPFIGEFLELLKESILECEEFEECEELIILDYPLVKDGNGSQINLPSFKLIPGQHFKGKCYLYSITLTPPMFIGKDLVKLVKDNAAISPITYSEDFKPNRRIVLSFNPDENKDSEALGQQLIRKQLHETLDKILDTPAEYLIEGERSVIVRGLFDIIVDSDGVERNLELVHPITTDSLDEYSSVK